MLGRVRDHLPLLLGILLVVAGAALLAFGAAFVQGWMWWAAITQPSTITPGPCPPTGSPGTCTVYVRITMPPNPGPLMIGYGLAIPALLAAAWRIHRGSGTSRAPGSRRRLRARLASALLVACAGFMGVFIGVGLTDAWSSVPAVPAIRILFLAAVLAAPLVALTVGAVWLALEQRRGLSGRSPTARG